MKQYQKISTTMHSILTAMKERSVILTNFLNTRGRLLLKQYKKFSATVQSKLTAIYERILVTLSSQPNKRQFQ